MAAAREASRAVTEVSEREMNIAEAIEWGQKAEEWTRLERAIVNVKGALELVHSFEGENYRAQIVIAQREDGSPVTAVILIPKAEVIRQFEINLSTMAGQQANLGIKRPTQTTISDGPDFEQEIEIQDDAGVGEQIDLEVNTRAK